MSIFFAIERLCTFTVLTEIPNLSATSWFEQSWVQHVRICFSRREKHVAKYTAKPAAEIAGSACTYAQLSGLFGIVIQPTEFLPKKINRGK